MEAVLSPTNCDLGNVDNLYKKLYMKFGND